MQSREGIIQQFISKETFGGFLLFACTIAALIMANSSLSEEYFALWNVPFGIKLGDFVISMDLTHWIDDGLMALFFLMVGLEIKRELLLGELDSVQKALFPAVAALGGMVAPALIYFMLNPSGEASNGFGIPMATDIAFALGVMMLLGKRVSLSLKVFLVSLAIVDDMGAVLIIAVAYTQQLNAQYLLYSLVVILILLAFNLKNHKNIFPYLVLGVALWIFIHASGVHATIAGVITAFFIPIRSTIGDYDFLGMAREELDNFEKYKDDKPLLTHKQHDSLEQIVAGYEQVQSPLVRLEHTLHPISAFFIMPIFAFSNAGVELGSGLFTHMNIFLGIFLGLIVGKSVGITLFTYLADKIGVAKKPANISWGEVFGASLLAGIGFTMSIFIAFLAFNDPTMVDSAKGAILIASLTAGVLGAIYLTIIKKDKK